MKKICFLGFTLLLLLGCVVTLTSCSGSPDKSKLYDSLTQMHVSAEGYTAASYEVYRNAYNDASAVYQNPDATSLEIDNAISRLTDSYNALKKTADFSQLKLAIAVNDTIDAAKYTPESYNTYLSAYRIAMEVYQNDASSQNEINSAVTSLNNAIQALVKIPDSSSLQLLLQQVINPGDYTSESYAVYKEAYDSATRLVSSTSVTKAELLLAEELLKQSIYGLVGRGDVLALSSYLTSIGKVYLIPDEKNRPPQQYYSQKSFAEFNAVLDRANEIVSTGDASEEQIELLKTELKKAADALVNIGGLIDRIDMLADYEKVSYFYTTESYDELVAAASEVIGTASSNGPSREDVQSAEDKFDASVLKLKRRDVVADDQYNKNLKNRLIVIGNSSMTLQEYLQDYTVFFQRINEENPTFSYIFEGEDTGALDVIFTYENTRVVLHQNGIELIYNGTFPVSDKDIFAASFGGINFSVSEFDISSTEKFGAPTQYYKRTETVMGKESTVAVLTYYEEDGTVMVVEYDTIRNFVSSVRITAGAPDEEN